MVSAFSSLHTEVRHRETASGSPAGQGRRVLVIAYHWPPDTSIGAIRPVKLVAQLKAHGWEPIILTVNERYYEQVDTKLTDSAAGSIMIRTRCLPNFPRLYVAMRRFLAKLFVRSTEPSPAQGEAGVKKQDVTGSGRGGDLRRIFLSIMNMPDEHIGWLPFGLWQALKAVRKYHVTCMISTGPPFTAHIVALLTRVLSRVVWIADFRDPWFMLEGRSSEATSGVSNWMNKRIERAVVHCADRVVCVTPFMTQWYRTHYPELPSSHWETITNGFSAGEFEAVAGVPLSAKFTISYLGSIEYERTPELVFQAVRDLCQEGLMQREDVAIRLVGKCHEVLGRPMTELIATYMLSDIVTVVRAVPRHEALKEMRQAHVLLLLATNQKLQIPGKAYEYIGAGRRILAITEPEWSTADVIRSIGGAVVAQGDVREMKRVLENWYGEYRCGLDTRGKSFELGAKALEFEWSRLGARYAQILSSVC